MDFKKVLYSSSLTKKVQYCTTSHLKLAKSMTLLTKDYLTRNVVNELVLSSSFILKSHLADVEKSRRLDFVISDLTEKRIVISVTGICAAKELTLGKIIFSKGRKIIRNLQGEAAIEILEAKPEIETEILLALENFALGVGLFLLCKQEKTWPDSKGKQGDAFSQRELVQRILVKRNQVSELEKKIQLERTELEARVLELETILNKQQKLIFELETELAKFKEK